MGSKSRANKGRPKQAVQPQQRGAARLPAWVKPWGVLTVVLGGAFAFIIQSDVFFKNLQELPATADSTLARFQSWVYEDEEWTGKWATDGVEIEGDIASETMGISGEARLEIDVSRGDVEGFITTKRVCQEVPLLGALMIQGSVFGDSAKVRVWEYVGGREVTFARVKLIRKHGVIEVAPINDDLNLFLRPTRLARVVNHVPEAPKSIFEYCRAERDAYVKPLYEEFMRGK